VQRKKIIAGEMRESSQGVSHIDEEGDYEEEGGAERRSLSEDN
jgi:hypothetical protein